MTRKGDSVPNRSNEPLEEEPIQDWEDALERFYGQDFGDDFGDMVDLTEEWATSQDESIEVKD